MSILEQIIPCNLLVFFYWLFAKRNVTPETISFKIHPVCVYRNCQKQNLSNNKQAIRTVPTRKKNTRVVIYLLIASNYSTLTFLVCDNYTLKSHYLSYFHCSNDYNDHDIDEHEDNDETCK